MKKLLIIGTGLLLIFSVRPAAQAQYSPLALPSWHDYGVMRQQTMNGYRVRRLRSRAANSGSSAPQSSGRSTPRPSGGTSSSPRSTSAPTGGTTFHPVAGSLAPQSMAARLSKTPAERQRLERIFSDLLDNYREQLQRAGGPTNDVSRAASFLVSASYAVYHDGAQLSLPQFTALREYMREAFAGDSIFQRMSERDKQQLFEGYAIVGAWIDLGYTAVKKNGDEKAMGQWREMAKTNLEQMLGVPANQVRITDDGVDY
jgi:hypothetical protein